MLYCISIYVTIYAFCFLLFHIPLVSHHSPRAVFLSVSPVLTLILFCSSSIHCSHSVAMLPTFFYKKTPPTTCSLLPPRYLLSLILPSCPFHSAIPILMRPNLSPIRPPTYTYPTSHYKSTSLNIQQLRTFANHDYRTP